MRAVVLDAFGAYGSGRVLEIERPAPEANEVLVEVRAAPVNYVDLVVAAGKYQFPPALPYTPGKGPAGIVAAVGDGVTGLSLGTRVLAMAEGGGYAEFVCAPASDCHRIPDGMSFSQAAAISLAYDTAWVALRDRARLSPGETVLVLGSTGAVGRAAIMLGRALGARVLAAVSSPARADVARAAGAEAIVDLSRPDLRDDLRRQVFELTDGSGADVVIDMLGSDPFDAAIRAVAWRGRVVVVGFAAGRIPTLKINYLMLKNIEVSGLQISDYRKRRPDLMAECYREIFDLFAKGLLDPGGITELPLEKFADGMRLLERRGTTDRVVLRP